MKKFLIFLILITACVPSIHPLYHEKDLIMDEQLLGLWGNSGDGEFWDGRESWKFEKLLRKKGFFDPELIPDSRPGYQLTITLDSVPAIFEVRLLKLQDQYFLDLYPKKDDNFEIPGIKNEWLRMHLFPVHTFARLRFEGKNMTIEPFNPDFIIDLLEQKKIRISHEESDGQFILTAGTDELQKFVLKFGHEKEAYIDPGVFTRM